MASSNYRLVRHGHEVTIREVFYDERGAVAGVGEQAVVARAESVEALAGELRRYEAALALPVLESGELPRAAEAAGRAGGDVRVYFGVFGDWQDPQPVTAVIGREPTSFKAAGSPIGPGGKARARRSTWAIESGLPTTAPVEEQLAALLRLLEPHAAGIRSVARSHSAGVLCAAYWTTCTPGIHLGEEHLRRLAALELSFDLDMYFLE